MSTSTPDIARTATPVRLPLVLLCALLLLRTALLFGGDGIAVAIARAVGARHPWPTALLWSNVTVVIVDLITVGVVILACRREGRSVRELLGRFRRTRDLLLVVPLAIGLYLALFIGTFIGNLVAWGGAPPAPPAADPAPLWLGVWSISILPITVAIAEELFYRGFLLGRLTERWGWWPAAVVVSVAFGLQHAAFSATSLQAVLARAIAAAILGLVFALLLRALKSLIPLIVAHWLVDAVGLGLPVLLASLGSGG